MIPKRLSTGFQRLYAGISVLSARGDAWWYRLARSQLYASSWTCYTDWGHGFSACSFDFLPCQIYQGQQFAWRNRKRPTADVAGNQERWMISVNNNFWQHFCFSVKKITWLLCTGLFLKCTCLSFFLFPQAIFGIPLPLNFWVFKGLFKGIDTSKIHFMFAQMFPLSQFPLRQFIHHFVSMHYHFIPACFSYL